jgi:hypothetical protein
MYIPKSGSAKWMFNLYEEDSYWDTNVSQFEMPNAEGTYWIVFDDGIWWMEAEFHVSKLTYPTESVYIAVYD